jgi:hypothetical protein
MHVLGLSLYSPGRAILKTQGAARAFVRIDVVLDEGLADFGGTILVFDVSNVFIPEVFQCG